MAGSDKQRELFDSGPAIKGFLYQPDFITPEEESALLAGIAKLPLQEAVYSYSVTFRAARVHA